MRVEHRRRVAVLVVAVAAVIGIAFGVLAAQPDEPDASLQSATVVGSLPDAIEGWDATQLANAAIIMQAGADLGFGERDVTIAVMTAMGESSLTVLDHGDAAGPDSRGLFQQRDGWGPYEVRMDAYGSAVLFFEALGAVEDRDGLEPTIVAHTVQVNDDPWHYAPYWDDAVAVVGGLEEAYVDVVVSPS